MSRCFIIFLFMLFSNQFVFAQTFLEKTPENHETIKSCGGNNLLKTISAQDKAKLKEKTSAILNGKGIFWKIEKEGVAPSWLLGTIHATDERVLKLKAPIQQHLAKADRVVLELAEIQDKKAMMQASSEILFKNQELMNFPNGKTFKQEIPQEFQNEIEAVLKSHGLTTDLLFSMKPWLVYTTIVYPKCENKRIKAGLPVLDEEIALLAKNNIIPVHGLETVEEQTISFATIPDKVQFELIAKSAKTDQSQRDIFETMIDTYLDEDIATILKMNDVFEEYKVSQQAEDIFNEALLNKRNHRMAERMVPMINLGNSFFAVGAAHLPDEEGIIELLRQKGFTLTRVELEQ